MAANRVSVDGISHSLPQPFVVIATQNSLDQVGTSPLPEAQLDRFLMRIHLGFPDRQAERALLKNTSLTIAEISSGLDPAALMSLQQQCRQQHTSGLLLDYVLDLVEASRGAGVGLSPRASQGLLAAARAWSLLQGRDHVRIDDVQAVFPSVAEHRLDSGALADHSGGSPLSQTVLQKVNALR